MKNFSVKKLPHHEKLDKPLRPVLLFSFTHGNQKDTHLQNTADVMHSSNCVLFLIVHLDTKDIKRSQPFTAHALL